MSPSLRSPIRRIESGFLRTLAYIGGFLLATLLVSIVLGVANSNIFWGEANQVARIDIPAARRSNCPPARPRRPSPWRCPGAATRPRNC